MSLGLPASRHSLLVLRPRNSALVLRPSCPPLVLRPNTLALVLRPNCLSLMLRLNTLVLRPSLFKLDLPASFTPISINCLLLKTPSSCSNNLLPMFSCVTNPLKLVISFTLLWSALASPFALGISKLFSARQLRLTPT